MSESSKSGELETMRPNPVWTADAYEDALAVWREVADEVVCLQVPRLFFAVGQYFHEFEQVTDEEVIELLEEAHDAVSDEDLREPG